ncbi:helix-turn-helix domain-containing protein [Treponema sp. OttesenSCG-928-L16]|nr:helix-turn-helix domain-containing protein [Treponema sp. OttesenSCG-928-L16]
MSQHLAVLKENGVVDSVIQGNKRIYSIADNFIREIIAKMVSEVDAAEE